MIGPNDNQYVYDVFVDDGDENRIVEATVFTDQAYLKRRTSVEVENGLNRFIVGVNAFNIDRHSVQAAVFGEGEIVSVQYRETPVRESRQIEVHELELHLEELKRKRLVITDESERCKKQIRFLDSAVAFSETEIPKRIKTRFPKAEDMETMLEFLDRSYQKLDERSQDLTRRIEELDKDIVVVEEKLKQTQRPHKKLQKGIEVVFKSDSDQQVDVEASYVALNASWEPVYKVDVPTDLSGVTLTMFAQIYQKTGENWDNLELTVSNAVPLKGALLPELESWRLFLEPLAPMAGAPMAAASEVFLSKRQRKRGVDEEVMLDALAEPEPEAEFVQAETRELPTAFEYKLSQPVNIASGSGHTVLPLYTKEMKGEFFAYAVPKIDPLPYLVCNVQPDRELLPGVLNVHFGGRFVDSVGLSEKKAGEELLVNLGVERAVKIRRDKTVDKLAETFFGVVDRQSVAREIEHRIVVENQKDEKVRMRILDAVPVSETDRIQVKGVEMKPDPKEKDFMKKEGVMLWDFQLDPNGTREIVIGFHIKHPKDRKPMGI